MKRSVKVKVGDRVAVPSHRVTQGKVARILFVGPRDGQYVVVRTSTGNEFPVFAHMLVKGRKPASTKRRVTRIVRRAKSKKTKNPAPKAPKRKRAGRPLREGQRVYHCAKRCR